MYMKSVCLSSIKIKFPSKLCKLLNFVLSLLLVYSCVMNTSHNMNPCSIFFFTYFWTSRFTVQVSRFCRYSPKQESDFESYHPALTVFNHWRNTKWNRDLQDAEPCFHICIIGCPRYRNGFVSIPFRHRKEALLGHISI